jgi:hypothetical protein
MQIVYRAENMIDAHLISGLLAQEGISAFVTGGYLTGAIGELPVSGLVAVMVAETDWDAARAAIEAFEASTPMEASMMGDDIADFDDDNGLSPRPA